VLTLREVRLRRGPRVLFEDASLAIFRGDKVGVVGRNGSGKTSLLALVTGELAPDLGDYAAPANLRIAAVAQSVPDTPQAVVEFVRAGDAELIAIEQALAVAHAAGDGTREAQLHDEYDAAGGYASRSRAAALATGLGFAAGDIERPLGEFSGGLRMRAALARALMPRSDVLLLDEPTNHLDLDAVLWLEQWLRAYRGTLLIVSHDREFLDAIVGRIVHLADGSVTAYTGNYTAFERQWAAARERSAALAERERREVAHIESFVARFRAKASKAPQVQSRLKWLARMPALIAAREDESFAWTFVPPSKLPRPLVHLDGVAAGYAPRMVLERVSLSIAPGDRLGVLGRNGAGKSTLMRTLAGTLAPLAGERTAAPDLVVGFFAQLEVEQLDAGESAIMELARRGGPGVATWSPQQKRDHLGQFGFRGERVFEPVGTFSGGERARLTLAVLVARRPNLLLLDEPTNHLDFEMRSALLLALQDYDGAVIVVSHDRSLLRGACDRFVVVRERALAPFDGDLEDYAAWLARAEAAPAAPRGSAAEARRSTRRREAESRNRLAPLRAELAALERDLEGLGARRAQVERRLADPELYAGEDRDEPQRVASEHEALMARIRAGEERWLEISERMGEPEGSP
jgi:ATP-binding cassette subfamily F protein 3